MSIVMNSNEEFDEIFPDVTKIVLCKKTQLFFKNMYALKQFTVKF